MICLVPMVTLIKFIMVVMEFIHCMPKMQASRCSTVSEPLIVIVNEPVIPTIIEKKRDGIISILIVDNSDNLFKGYKWTYSDGSDLPSGLTDNEQFLTLSGSYLNNSYMVNVIDINNCKSTSEIIDVKGDLY